MQNTKKAILVVSFGTSYNPTREKTIDVIEKEVAEAFPDYQVYRAWTSKMIMAKILKRDGVKINNVKEAMEQMLKDQVTEVIVQPTHVINGIENERMKEDALSYQKDFARISFGTPLLTSEQDSWDMIEAIHEEFSCLTEDEDLVLMGHGTTHYANSIYAALDYSFKDKGYANIHLGTVEAYPSMETLLKKVTERNPRKVYLAPFMIVAGDHARNDLAGNDPDSWLCQFQAKGFSVVCCLKGLGEYPAVRKLLIRHVQDALDHNM